MATRKPKTGRRLILADGTTYENGEAGYYDGVLWCYVPDKRIPDVAPVFSDPARTAVIKFEYGEMADTYEGFTEVSAMLLGDNEVKISLRKVNANDV